MSVFPTWAYFEAQEVKQTWFIISLVLDYVRQDNFVYTAQKDSEIRSIDLKYISEKRWVDIKDLREAARDVILLAHLKLIWIDNDDVFYFKYCNDDEEDNRD